MVHHINVLDLIVIRSVMETPGYRSVFFERPRGFNFEPGDWMDIILPADQPPGGKTFSFSSSPEEPELRITFKDGRSPFKLVLQALKPGDKLVTNEYGNDYGFQLHEHRVSTLIAGGVGVAPFRSMLKRMAEEGSKNAVHLIYFNSSPDFLFRDEFDVWEQQLPNLQITFVPTKNLKRKERENFLREAITDTDQRFYISGPTEMVQATRSSLYKIGVKGNLIKIDDFGQY